MLVENVQKVVAVKISRMVDNVGSSRILNIKTVGIMNIY